MSPNSNLFNKRRPPSPVLNGHTLNSSHKFDFFNFLKLKPFFQGFFCMSPNRIGRQLFFVWLFGMYLVFSVIVIVTVLFQCLSCSFGQNQKVNIADMHYDYDYDNDKKQDTKSVLKTLYCTLYLFKPYKDIYTNLKLQL